MVIAEPQTKPARRIILRILRGAVLVVLLTIVALELILTFTDPLGLVYFQLLEFSYSFYGAGLGGYAMSPGEYEMNGWSAHVNDDLTRRVPNSGGVCRVLFVGDSVTWGWGVNDEDVFVNVLAAELGIEAVAAAIPGYSSENIVNTLSLYDNYDLAVYLMIPNDHEETFQWTDPLLPKGTHQFGGFAALHGKTPAVVLYAQYFTTDAAKLARPTDLDRFFRDLEAIKTHSPLVIFAFDSPLTAEAVQRHDDIIVLPWFTSNVSRIDPHPNQAGHQQIADAMLPVIRERLGETCAA